MKTIFVAIASYRDRECQWTVQDLFLLARHPERVFVGLCDQVIRPDDDACFELPPPRPDQVRTVTVDARQSLGACWAKRTAHGLRRGEDYVLQVDSHMRFGPGWDEELLSMLAQCPADKAALSTYPAAYFPPRMLSESTLAVVPREFDRDRMLALTNTPITIEAPMRGAFFAGGFIFAEARLFDEVPYDPNIYFLGEESSFSARAFTRGWDVFIPHRCVLYHLYTRKDQPRHWSDNDWVEMNRRSIRRVRHLFGTEPCAQPELLHGLDGEFGFGAVRSFSDFQQFCGVDFKAMTIAERSRRAEYARAGNEPASITFPVSTAPSRR